MPAKIWWIWILAIQLGVGSIALGAVPPVGSAQPAPRSVPFRVRMTRFLEPSGSETYFLTCSPLAVTNANDVPCSLEYQNSQEVEHTNRVPVKEAKEVVGTFFRDMGKAKPDNKRARMTLLEDAVFKWEATYDGNHLSGMGMRSNEEEFSTLTKLQNRLSQLLSAAKAK